MEHPYKLVIFDVDGTLLDTSEGVISAVKYTIEEHNLRMPDNNELLKFIGPPIQKSFEEYYGFSGTALQELADTFRNRYKSDGLFKAIPYEGIYDVLEEIKKSGVKIGIATYKRQDYAESIIKYFNFNKYAVSVFGADNFNKLKKKDIIKNCIKAEGITDYSQVVMVGDSDNDAVGADEIGVKFIGVTYGFGFKNIDDVNEYPNAGCANTTDEILKYI